MADLSLKVKVEGKEQLEALWQKFEQGKATLKDVTQIKKDMNTAFKGEIIGTDAYNKFAGQLATINDLQRDVRIQTKAGHEAYFKAGLEVRQLALSSGLLKGALGGVTSELANSVLNAVQLKQALVPLGISMGGVGIAIVAIVAILPTMISLLSDSAGQAERHKKAMESWSASIKDAKVETLNSELFRLNKLLVEIEENNKRFIKNSPLGITMFGWLGMQLLGTNPEETKKRIKELEDKLVEVSRGGPAEEAARQRGYEMDEADRKVEAHQKKLLAIDAESDRQKKYTNEEADRQVEAHQKKLKDIDDEAARQRGYENDEADRKVTARQKELQKAQRQQEAFEDFVSSSLQDAFSGTFAQQAKDLNRFLWGTGGEAHSWFQMLVQDVAQLGLRLAETAVIAQLLSLILGGAGGGFGAIFQGMTGISISGGGAKSGAGGGSSPISNTVRNAAMSRAGGSRGGGGFGNLQLRTEIAGSKLAVIVESGDRINARSRY